MFWGVFGRSRVATKSKLERAVEDGASKMNDAQREIVMSQFRDYKRNKARISEIDGEISAQVHFPAGSDAMKAQLARKMSLDNERALLVKANNEIAAKLFEQLADKE